MFEGAVRSDQSGWFLAGMLAGGPKCGFFAIRISSASHRPLVHPRRSHPLQPVERKCGLMSLSFVRQVATDKRPRSARRRSAPSPRRISRGIFHLVSRREGKARQGLKFPRSSRRYRSLPSSPVQCSLNKPPRYPARSSRSLPLSPWVVEKMDKNFPVRVVRSASLSGVKKREPQGDARALEHFFSQMGYPDSLLLYLASKSGGGIWSATSSGRLFNCGL